MQGPIHVKSEIGPLQKVLLHRPGRELEYLVPDALERLLFDDIPYLHGAQQEHDRFVQLLRENGTEVVFLEDLTAEAIEKTFGAHVADLVSFETEGADPETGWRERRQAELDRLKDADEEQLILALSDRLSDARALSREYAALKDELWQRFNQADRREQAWYYKALVVAFKPLERFGAYGEFKHLISSVFARRRAAKSAPEENNG